MAGRRKTQLPPNDSTLNADFWQQFGRGSEPSVRDKLLFLSMIEIGRSGPADFNGLNLCHRLNVSPSLINHYFGGRDGLIAEATAVGYQRYVTRLTEAAISHESEPREALRAWIREQIKWSSENPGLGAILNYSSAFGVVNNLIRRDFQRDITSAFEWNIAVLTALIRAVRDGTVLRVPRNEEETHRESLLTHHQDLMLVTSFAWSVLGSAVWASGQHTPSLGTGESKDYAAAAVESHIERLIGSLEPNN